MKETLPGHNKRVICLSFIEKGSTFNENECFVTNAKYLGHEADMKDIALVSGSADFTAKIWKQNNDGKVRNKHCLYVDLIYVYVVD